MKNILIIRILLLFLLIPFMSCKFENQNTEVVKSNYEGSLSSSNFFPTSSTQQIINHKYYSLSYSEKHEQAEWVAYVLRNENLKNIHYKRPYFIEDEKVVTRSADWRNYRNSGYDKGHLCPAGDMKLSKAAYEETFLTSNISPQKHDFNTGIWNRLEQKTRYWAEKYGEVFVITGGILNNGLKTIGKEKVTVPDYFYKIIAAQSKGEIKVIAFLLPHKESKDPLYSFVTSVDEIEKLTQIDFFYQLDDNLENEIEKNKDYKEWSFD